MISEGSFRNEVVQYDPEIILQMCNHVSTHLFKQGETIATGSWLGRMGAIPLRQNIHITHHKIALLAMIALQNYPWASYQQPQRKDFIRLVNNTTSIEDPFLKKKQEGQESLVGILVRLAHQQFPFQENIHHTLPRHLLLYLDTQVASPPINPDAMMHSKMGLTIKDFMTIGISFFAASLERNTFDRKFIENTQIKSLKPYIKPENITAFLSVAAADFETFRNLCLQEASQFPDAGPYRFNPLFIHPIIILKDSRFCVPIPLLLLYRITKGLYYDFLDEFGSSNGNPFSEWFGYAFEQYGGLLLRDAFGAENVFEEPRYGKPEIRGPDWIIIQRDAALVLEFRSGRLNKRAKTYADYEEIATLLQRNVVDTTRKLPAKINDLRLGKTDLPLASVEHYIPAVVTYEPLYPQPLFREVVKQKLRDENVPEFNFELMSIEDLEWLLAWSTYENPIDFLRIKWSDPETKVMSVSNLIAKRVKEKSIKGIPNRLLDRTVAKYWQEIVPELDKSAQISD